MAVLLVTVGAAAVVRGTSRRARLAESVQPALGSPAQVWTARGERLLREMRTEVSPALAWVTDDAADVVEELRTTAARVAELDRALSRSRSAELRAARDGLVARMEAAVRGLERAKDQVTAIVIDPGVRSVTGDADERLADRVEGLRAGVAEVHRLAAPVDGQGIT